MAKSRRVGAGREIVTGEAGTRQCQGAAHGRRERGAWRWSRRAGARKRAEMKREHEETCNPINEREIDFPCGCE